MDELVRAALRSRLSRAGAAIAGGRAAGRFALIEADQCRAIGCGFLQRCHGREQRSAAPASAPRAQLVMPW